MNNRYSSFLLLVVIASVACQMEGSEACKLVLERFLDTTTMIIPQNLTTIPGGERIEQYVIAYCKELTLEELSEVIVSLKIENNPRCESAILDFLVASQSKSLSSFCTTLRAKTWRKLNPIPTWNFNRRRRLLMHLMTEEGMRLYDEEIFKIFNDVAQACE